MTSLRYEAKCSKLYWQSTLSAIEHTADVGTKVTSGGITLVWMRGGLAPHHGEVPVTALKYSVLSGCVIFLI
jgi:hypothetical protein